MRGPVLRCGIRALAAVARPDHQSCSRQGQRRVRETDGTVAQARGDSLSIGPLVVGINKGLDEAPQGITDQADGDDDVLIRTLNNFGTAALSGSGTSEALGSERREPTVRRVSEAADGVSYRLGYHAAAAYL